MPSMNSYEALITSQHFDKPKFMAMVRAEVENSIATFNALQKLVKDFSLDEAVGAQLDQVGQWIGRSRQLEVPLEGVYFSFDIEGLGFDQGVWLGPYDPDTQFASLDDDSYRALLRIKALTNSWDGSNQQAQEIWAQFCQQVGIARPIYEDRQDMTVSIGAADMLNDAVIRGLILSGYIPLKPAGVRTYFVMGSVPETPLFGFDFDNATIAGFDTGAWGALALA